MAKRAKKKTARKKTSAKKATRGRASSARTKKASDGEQLQEYFLEELKDVYGAEKMLTKALPRLQKAATTDELKNALEEHLAVTEEQIARLEEVFEMLDKKAQAKKCKAMEGITKEAESVMKDTQSRSMTRDAVIIMAAQKAEHYEIASYGGLVSLAKTMGRNDIADLLHQTLDEEKEADELLTQLAKSKINVEAAEREAMSA